MARRPVSAKVIHGPVAPMTSQPGSNPAVFNPTIGQPAKAVPGDGLAGSDEPTMRPVEGPNKAFSEGAYRK